MTNTRFWIMVASSILWVAGCGGVREPGVAQTAFTPVQGGIAQQEAREGSNVGNTAPDFCLENLSGKEITLRVEGEKQQVTMLVFWATWCGFCRRELPLVGKFFNEYSSRGVRVLSLNMDKRGTKVSSFTNRAGINFPVLLDKNWSTTKKYRVQRIPNVLVLDTSGIVCYNGHSTAEAKGILDKILEAQPEILNFLPR